jgi:hypothetical protein
MRGVSFVTATMKAVSPTVIGDSAAPPGAPGDLRPYAVVQFLPLLLIPLLLLRPGALHTGWLWATLGAYIAAKLAEHFDGAILDAFGLFSGHSLKHLLAALGAWCALRAFQRSPARAL